MIVAGIASTLEQRMPHIGLAEGLGGEDPVQKGVALAVVAVGVDLDIAASRRDAFDFPDRLDAGIRAEIMDDIDAKRCGDAAARERQLLRSAANDATAWTRQSDDGSRVVPRSGLSVAAATTRWSSGSSRRATTSIGGPFHSVRDPFRVVHGWV